LGVICFMKELSLQRRHLVLHGPLVEHLKHPGLSFEQLAVHLQQQRQLTVTAESIRRFFTEHDLKKTPEPQIPEH